MCTLFSYKIAAAIAFQLVHVMYEVDSSRMIPMLLSQHHSSCEQLVLEASSPFTTVKQILRTLRQSPKKS